MSEEEEEELARHRLPDEPSKKDYAVYPFLLIKCYFQRILQICRWRFVVFLVISQMLIKGLLYRMVASSVLPIFKDLGLAPAEVQIFITIASSPWSIKPVIGVLSDLLTFRGYHKRFWLIQSVLVGSVAAALMFPAAGAPSLLILMFVGVNYEMAIVDLMTEGKYAEKMQQHPASGSDLVTFVTALQTAGSIVAMSFVGEVGDQKLFWIIFLLAALTAAVPLVPSMLGWLPEERSANRALVVIDRGTFRQHKAIFIVVLFTGVSGFVLGFLLETTTPVIALVSAVLMMTASIVGAFMAFPRVVAYVALYQVLVRLAKPSLGSGLDFFFTASPTCLPGGPNFSFRYYITFTGLMSSVVALCTTWIYQALFSKWRFRSILIFSSVLVGVGGLSDLVIVLRLNKEIGISDKTFYFIGEAIFESTVEMLFWIPSSVIISKVCKPSLSTIYYSFIAGFSNFGYMLAELVGSQILHLGGIRQCSFDSLWKLVLAFHICLPIVGGVAAAFLIPNVSQEEMLLKEEEEDEYVELESVE